MSPGGRFVCSGLRRGAAMAAAYAVLANAQFETQFQCNEALTEWEMWPEPQKRFCCDHGGHGCDPWDCSYQLSSHDSSWQPAKVDWCCHNRALGCAPKFDCNAGWANWELGWSDPQKTWCCEKQGKACDPFDCNFANPDMWAEAKKEYCCPKTGRGCPTTTTSMPFDCEAGWGNWELGWSDPKKTWCCEKQGKACDPFDCNFANPEMWAESKKEYCCPRTGKGCPTTTTSLPFDCEAGWASWEAGWSEPKKTWCCERQGKACDPFDCNFANPDMWAEPKKEYCCPRTGRGCPMTTTTTSVPFDCEAGWGNWEFGWSDPKKTWCCEKQGRACDPFDCTFANPDMWAESKKAYCCPKTGMGCPTTTTSLPFDCNAGYANWEEGWSGEKKTWCCVYQGKACDPYDCDAAMPERWTGAKVNYCCLKFAKACPTTTMMTTTTVPFDCEAGWANWELEWSTPKKTWCCEKQGRACDPFDCNLANPDMWAEPKREYCCPRTGRGCPTTTTSLPFDCEAGWANWEEGWSGEKKTWCCVNQGKACDPFNCDEGPPGMWPGAKQVYCCANRNLGCPTTTTVPFDCNAGWANWEEGWSAPKKTWCCEKQGKACDPFDCNFANPDMWAESKKAYCCPKTGQGCFECNAGWANWENAWSANKKTYCCQHAGKACDRYDCDLGLANARNSWCEDRKTYCCGKYHKGCDEGFHVLTEVRKSAGAEGKLERAAGRPLAILLLSVVVPLASLSWGVAAWRQGRERLRGRLLGRESEWANDVIVRALTVNEVE